MARWIALALMLSLVLPTATSAGPAGTVHGDPQAIAELRAAQEKFAAAKSWRSRRTMSAPGASLPATATEFVAPDRTRMSWPDGRGGTAGTVIIGRDVWNFGSGACAKGGSAPARVQDDRESVRGRSDVTMEITKGGRETVDGTPTQTYTRASTTSEGQVREKFFVAIDNGYPRRIEMTVQQAGVTVTITIDYSDYDTPITINPPC
ncbi:MAG: hypothetical protein ACRDGN_03800 [bacterium]